MSNVDLLAVMTDWLHHDAPEAASNMQLLVDRWMETSVRYETSQPFLLLIQKLAIHTGQGHTAALVLDRWVGKLGGHLSLAPTLQAFHLVLDGYTRSHRSPPMDAMMDIVSFLERENMNPTVETYSLLTAGFERTYETLNWREEMIHTVGRMDTAWENTRTPYQSYHYIRGYARAIGWALKAKQWRLGMEWYAKIQVLLEQPNLVHETVEHQLEESKNHVPKLIGYLASDYLSILFRSNESQNKQKVDPILHSAIPVLSMLAALNMDNLPWANHYSLIIERWSRTMEPGLIEFFNKAENRRLEQSKQVPISWYSLTLLYATKMNIPNDCENLLERVMALFDTDQLRGATDPELTRCWNHVLAAVPYDRVPVIWEAFQARRNMVTPNYATYNFVLWGLARCVRSINHPHALQSVNQVLLTMADEGFPPQASHYGAAITAWTTSFATDAAYHADMLLQELEEKYNQTHQEWYEPRIDMYTNIIGAYGRSNTPMKALSVFERMKGLKYVQADAVVYGALINALSKGRSVEAAEKGEEILWEMENAANTQRNPALLPNSHVYTSCIKAWSLSRAVDAPQRAERLISHMEDEYDIKPDAVCYASLVDVWANSLHPDSGKKAETWLRRLQDTGEKLNRVIYTNVIAAWWRSKADQPERALAILQEMKDEHANGNVNAAPDNRTYTTVIQAIAASTRPDKAVLGWKLLEEMAKSYQAGNEMLKPTVFPFTAVLNACAFTSGQNNIPDAIKVALLVLNEMQNLGISLNHITYRTALTVFNPRNDADEQMKQEKEKMAKLTFQMCCRDGQVHPDILEVLFKHHPKIYNRIPKNSISGIVQMPPEWTVNVRAQ